MGRRTKQQSLNDLEKAARAVEETEKTVDSREKGRGYNHKWDDSFAFRINNLARAGKNHAQIAEDLGVHIETFSLWRKKKPLVRAALKDAKEHRQQKPFVDSIQPKKQASFRDFIYRHLPDHLRLIWDEVLERSTGVNPVSAIRDLMDSRDEDTQKHLFIHAMCCGNFSKARACSQLMLSRNTLNRWIDTDADFVECLAAIQDIKKDYVEGKLFERIEDGDTMAILFASRTLNRETYSEKTEVNVTGSIKHEHQIDIDALGLDLAAKRRLLEEHRAKKEITLNAESVNVG